MDDNKGPVLRYVQELANGDLDIADEIFAPDFVYHFSSLDAEVDLNLEQYLGVVRLLLRDFPDWRGDATAVIAEGDLVVDRVQVNATHSGGPAPTGEEFKDVEVVHIWRVENAKLKELWVYGSRTFYRMTSLVRR